MIPPGTEKVIPNDREQCIPVNLQKKLRYSWLTSKGDPIPIPNAAVVQVFLGGNLIPILDIHDNQFSVEIGPYVVLGCHTFKAVITIEKEILTLFDSFLQVVP